MGSKDRVGISGRTSVVSVYSGDHIPATNEAVGVVE
jgi:hypothetical protein